jgi:hypothetical protein
MTAAQRQTDGGEEQDAEQAAAEEPASRQDHPARPTRSSSNQYRARS